MHLNTLQTCAQLTPLGPKKWPLWTVDRCSEVICEIKVLNGTSKWWSL